MTTHPRARLVRPDFLIRGAALAATLTLGAGAWQPVQALDVGHARILSSVGQSLRLIVPLTGLSPDEAATLVVRPADAAAWRQSGLTPPVALAGLSVAVRPGAQASRRELIVTAAEAPRGDVIDMLLDLTTSAGRRRIQISFVVPAQTAEAVQATQATQRAANVRAPRVSAAQAAGSVAVRRGDMLSRIAQRHRYDGASLYQMMAALYQTNPQAFIQHNMNLVKSGTRLTMPDAATVRAIDPAEARRLFLEHGAAFARYRAGIGGDVGTVAGGTPESGRLGAAAGDVPAPATAAGDRVRLSNTTPSAAADQAADEQVARARAEQDSAARVAQLERNVDEMSQALADRGAQAGSSGSDHGGGSVNGNGSVNGHADGNNAATGTAALAGSDSGSPVGASSAQDTAGASTVADAATGASSSPGATGGAGLSLPTAAAASREAEPSGSWWSDNLLALILGLLAVLALIVTWVMRRGGAHGHERRGDEVDPLAAGEPFDGDDGDDGDLDDDAPAVPSDAMQVQFARRLDSIDLDLENPPDSNGHPPRR